MEKTTFNVLFYIRRTKLDRNGEAPILMRLTVNGMRGDIYLKKFLLPDEWNSAKGKAYERNKRCKEINMYLNAVKMRMIVIHRELELDGQILTAKAVIDKYTGRDIDENAVKRPTILELFAEHNKRCHQLMGAWICSNDGQAI